MIFIIAKPIMVIFALVLAFIACRLTLMIIPGPYFLGGS